MNTILEFRGEFEEFEILKFDEDMIFNKPIEVSLNPSNVMFPLGVAPVRFPHWLLLEQVPAREGHIVCEKVQAEAD